MQLALDIGNTRVKAGVFSGEHLLKSVNFQDWDDNSWTALWEEYQIKRIIVSSVVQLEFEQLLKIPEGTERLDFNSKTSIPILNKYSTPDTLGKDRLAGAIG
ncbi:MAG TPA: type III pantothenate kinase, partial [Saprospiraceae bacterium]|nr:type III pantothenate kinase [Saprospiraceae bacterium]